MDDQPAPVMLPGEDDRLDLVLGFFTDLRSLEAVDGMDQDRHVTEHPSLQDLCLHRHRGIEAACFGYPTVPS